MRSMRIITSDGKKDFPYDQTLIYIDKQYDDNFHVVANFQNYHMTLKEFPTEEAALEFMKDIQMSQYEMVDFYRVK